MDGQATEVEMRKELVQATSDLDDQPEGPAAQQCQGDICQHLWMLKTRKIAGCRLRAHFH
jgi:hypothetical protein